MQQCFLHAIPDVSGLIAIFTKTRETQFLSGFLAAGFCTFFIYFRGTFGSTSGYKRRAPLDISFHLRRLPVDFSGLGLQSKTKMTGTPNHARGVGTGVTQTFGASVNYAFVTWIVGDTVAGLERSYWLYPVTPEA